MLIVSTDVDCTVIDRVELKVSRGSPDNVTYSQVFVRTECLPAGDPSLPHAVLANGAELRLGVQDSNNSAARLHVEVRGMLGPDVRLTTIAETDFVDAKVYGLPLALSQVCLAVTCTATSTCRVDPSSGGTVCATLYRAPGTTGLTPADARDQ